MEKLCIHYGPLIGLVDSKPYYDMPSPAALVDPKVEMHLRELGFGYRAKYLHQTALMISRDHGDGWLDSLRNPESPIMGCKVLSAGEMLPGGREGYRTAHEELLSLQGVGPKVADCVCLMGLGWGEAVPVDTHGMDHSHGRNGDLRLQLTHPQSGRLPSVTMDSEGESTEALQKLPMMPWEITSEVYGGKKLDGLIVSCSRLI